MIRPASIKDRGVVVKLFAASFDANPAVNDTIVNDKHRERRMQALMEYIFDNALARNGVYVTDDLLGALVMYDPVSCSAKFSDKLRQLKLVHRCIGWSRMSYVTAKGRKMAEFRPKTPHLHLQMIGTDPLAQGKGVGSKMMSFIQGMSAATSKTVYLETSVLKNVEMYKRKGFVVHGEWKIREDYHVHFMSWSK